MSAGGVVARELRATGVATDASRAARPEGIDYEGLPAAIAAAAIEPVRPSGESR
jgi:hypothetical protein